MQSRAFLKKLACLAVALALAAPLVAETHLEPAVQPGGDIPTKFRPVAPAAPRAGAARRRFDPPRADLHYVRREAMIPMCDVTRLNTELKLPSGPGRFPIL